MGCAQGEGTHGKRDDRPGYELWYCCMGEGTLNECYYDNSDVVYGSKNVRSIE